MTCCLGRKYLLLLLSKEILPAFNDVQLVKLLTANLCKDMLLKLFRPLASPGSTASRGKTSTCRRMKWLAGQREE